MTEMSALADPAVLLLVAVFVGLCLAMLGQRRTCVAWMAAVGGTFAVLLLLKSGLDLLVCLGGSDDLVSPGGHEAVATVVYGGVLLLLLRGAVPAMRRCRTF